MLRNVAYLAFKGAIWAKAHSITDYLIRNGIADAIRGDQSGKESVIALAVRETDIHVLEQLLDMPDRDASIARQIVSALGDAIAGNQTEASKKVLTLIIEKRPELLHCSDRTGCTILTHALKANASTLVERLFIHISRNPSEGPYIGPLHDSDLLQLAQNENALKALFETKFEIRSRQMNLFNTWSPKYTADLEVLIALAAKANKPELIAELVKYDYQQHLQAYDIYRKVLLVGGEKHIGVLLQAGLALDSEEKNRLVKELNLTGAREKLIREAKIDITHLLRTKNTAYAALHIGRMKLDDLRKHQDAKLWLFLAAQQGNSEICRKLLESGISPDYVVEKGRSVLRVATLSKEPATVELLLAHGVTIPKEAAPGRNVICNAISLLNYMQTQVLLSHYSPSEEEAKHFLELAISSPCSMTLETAARILLPLLDKPEYIGEYFLLANKNFSNFFEGIGALIKAGFRIPEDKLEELDLPAHKKKKILDMQRNLPPGAQLINALQKMDTASLYQLHAQQASGKANPLDPHRPGNIIRLSTEESSSASSSKGNTGRWELRFNPEIDAMHPVKRNVKWTNPVAGFVEEDLSNFSWHFNVIAAVNAMRTEESAAFKHLQDILALPELGIGLVDEHDRPIQLANMTSQQRATLDAQFYAIAVSRNPHLHAIVNSDEKDHAIQTTDSPQIAQSKRVAKEQAQALIEANEGFHPYRIRLLDQSGTGSILQAVENKEMSVEDALKRIDRENEKLQAQSTGFLEVLDSGLPETLVAWLGKEVTDLHARRGEELRNARASLEAISQQVRPT